MVELIEAGGPIAVSEPVEMEVLNGSSSPRTQREQRALLRRYDWLPFRSATDFEAATTIYRTCRVQGVTPRGSLGCMIAAVALRNDAVLLAADRDLVRIAQVMGIRLDPASVAPD
jgi:predicted nucleic acid-binding protein